MRFTKKRYSFVFRKKYWIVKICKQHASLSQLVLEIKKNGKTIGFVPTMGALHKGHLSLIKKSQKENDFTVVSIFVNPLQFNNVDDLKNYPRTIDSDIEKIKKTSVKNTLIYLPIHEELFPKNDAFVLTDLNGMDKEMEGEYRPGHFNGVVHVVHNLFKHVKPNAAYFGEKDFQQLAIIKHITKKYCFDIEIKSCKTIRDKNGLALSSRNSLLSEQEKKKALILYSTLIKIKKHKESISPKEALKRAKSLFKKSSLKLEYIHLVDSKNLSALSSEWQKNTTCCIAAQCGNVRLIDCMSI